MTASTQDDRFSIFAGEMLSFESSLISLLISSLRMIKFLVLSFIAISFYVLWYMCGVGIVSVSLFYVSLVIAAVCNKQETITSSVTGSTQLW